MNVKMEVAALERLTVNSLREHKQRLVRRIAWRMQALEGGDCPNWPDDVPVESPTTPTYK
jgi:hypothetical protein